MEASVTAPSPTWPDSEAPAWSSGRKVAFRFICSYFVLYNFPFPLDAIPFLESAVVAYSGLWHAVVPWVGQHLLHLPAPIAIFENGSGDTTYNYVQVLCFVVFAIVATVIWSLLDRNRRDYVRAHDWLRVYLRYSLGMTMIAYGAMKVIKSQFPNPGIYELLEPYGNASPMGLLWTFMGYSTPYNIFTGAAEMSAGILLALRRTTTLGALLAVAVLGNVVMLNFSYDVPVKLYSLHLLAMAGFLLLPDVARLTDVLLLNRAVPAAPVRPLFSRPQLNVASKALGVLLVMGFTALSLWQSQEGRKSYGDLALKPPLYGIYEVTTFVRNGDTLPPLATDSTRWRRLVLDQLNTVTTMNDSVLLLEAEVDTAKGAIALTPRRNTGVRFMADSSARFTLTYQRPDADRLTLAGVMQGDTIWAELVRRDEKEFLLLQRGFHWINEYPFNR